MENPKIYIDGLGYRNPRTESGQIIWYWEQTAKTKNKSHATRFWLDIKERLGEYLLKSESYELLELITKYATIAKELKRIQSRQKAKEIAEKETLKFNEWYSDFSAKRKLISEIGLN